MLGKIVGGFCSSAGFWTEPFNGFEDVGFYEISFNYINGFKCGFTRAFESSKILSILG
jgi:hypothetical protein